MTIVKREMDSKEWEGEGVGGERGEANKTLVNCTTCDVISALQFQITS